MGFTAETNVPLLGTSSFRFLLPSFPLLHIPHWAWRGFKLRKRTMQVSHLYKFVSTSRFGIWTKNDSVGIRVKNVLYFFIIFTQPNQFWLFWRDFGYFGVIFILSIIKTSTFQDNIDGASFSIFLKVLPELSCVGSEMKIANLMNIYDIGPRDHLWESLRDLHRGGLCPLQTRSSYPWVVQQFPGLENLLHFRF